MIGPTDCHVTNHSPTGNTRIRGNLGDEEEP